MFVSVLDVCGVWSQLDVHLLQAVLVSLSVRFFPDYPAERFVLNGKVKVMLLTMLFAIGGCAVE